MPKFQDFDKLKFSRHLTVLKTKKVLVENVAPLGLVNAHHTAQKYPREKLYTTQHHHSCSWVARPASFNSVVRRRDCCVVIKAAGTQHTATEISLREVRVVSTQLYR